MADALVSPAVAVTAGCISAGLLALAAVKVKKQEKPNSIAMMGVLGAFVFAAQMLNFAIPGTGSSGHVVGGVLLAAMLGPWSAFLTLACVLVIQCLVFADGGLMALGCNILNMGAMTCLVAYPLIYRPLMKYPASLGRFLWVTAATCVTGLECGAFLVTAETELSGITALNMGQFLTFMLPIHLAIGLAEGIATAFVLYFVEKSRPELLQGWQRESASSRSRKVKSVAGIAMVFAALALVGGVVASQVASENPDGLEWSIERLTGSTELPASGGAYEESARIQETTALMPDYDNRMSGVVGSLTVLAAAAGICALCGRRKKGKPVEQTVTVEDNPERK